MIFETVNELYLRVTCTNDDELYTKVGAMVGYKGECRFEKVLVGPDSRNHFVQAAVGQVVRRAVGENLPLMITRAIRGTIIYYSSDGKHVVVVPLTPGRQIMVESENLLAFTPDCKYSSKILAQGIISQRGFFTSVLTGTTSSSQVAILTNGNPLAIQSPCKADPDAVVAWTGYDPTCKLDVGWKNVINQASGESYSFDWPEKGAQIVIQPAERISGLDLTIDAKRLGNKPEMQQNPLDTVGSAAATVGKLGNLVNSVLR